MDNDKFINFQLMNGHGIRFISCENDKEGMTSKVYGQKNRQTFISPPKEQRGILNRDAQPYKSPQKYIKSERSFEKEVAGARTVAFQRSRGSSNDKNDKSRIDNRQLAKNGEENRREVLKFSHIRKKLQDEMRERQRLQELTICQELKLSNLQQQISKLRHQKKELERTIFDLQKENQQGKLHLNKASQSVQNLNRNIKEMRINQKSLSNLKNMQNQIEFLQEKNKKLTTQNQQLTQLNKSLRNQVDKIARQSTSESQSGSRLTKVDTVTSRSNEKKMHGAFGSAKTEKQRFLEANLHDLQRKLYQRQKEVKKMQIQLNCIDRKKVMSIDEVRVKKDRQIKDLRQKFMKVTKDLKETKDKFQKTEKKQQRSIKDSAFMRKVRSSKNLGLNSQSQVTLELSSQP